MKGIVKTMSNFLISLIHSFIELQGRNQTYEFPKFPDNNIVSESYDFKVGMFEARYLPSFPMIGVIVISPNGKAQLSEGGLVKLPNGSYTIRYVDCRQHLKTLPDVLAVTSDGFHVKLTLNITYQVTSLLATLENDNPLESLLVGCNAAIRSVIRIHVHDEFISENPNEQKVLDAQLANEIIKQVSMNRACRAFTLINITLLHREGDPKVMGIRQERLVQERIHLTTQEGLIQKQKIAEQERILNEIKVEGDVALKRLQAQFEAHREEIIHHANILKVDIEKRRKLPQYQHEEAIKSLDVGQKTIESLIHAQTMPGFPRTGDDLKLVEKIITGLPDIHRTLYEPGPEPINSDDDASATLIHLIVPKNRQSTGSPRQEDRPKG